MRRCAWQRAMSSGKRALLSATLLIMICVPAWAVEKCTGADGKVTFQNMPCAVPGITVAEDIKLKAQKRKEDAAKPQFTVIDVEANSTTARFDAARTACGGTLPDFPTIGMTEGTFKRCTVLGAIVAAESVNETETAAGVTKQYVYKKDVGVRYVYLRNGVITAIQR